MYPTSLRPALLDYASHFRAADLGGRVGGVDATDVLADLLGLRIRSAISRQILPRPMAMSAMMIGLVASDSWS
jgi:hypothetical protein